MPSTSANGEGITPGRGAKDTVERRITVREPRDNDERQEIAGEVRGVERRGGGGQERIRFRWKSGGQCKTVKLWKRGGTQCRLIDETKGFEGVGKASGVVLWWHVRGRERERERRAR